MAKALARAPTSTAITQCAPGPAAPDAEGFHHVPCHDGVHLRFKLLLGGPDGNHRFNPKKRTAICLHGLGDSLAFWEEGVFRVQPLPAAFKSFGSALNAGSAGRQSPADERRRAKFSRALAKHMNVVLLDQRGFGGSGRPCSCGPLQDGSLVALATFAVDDMESFTAAIRTDLEQSRASQHEGHSVSVFGRTALVRVVYSGVQQLASHALALLSLGSLTELTLAGLPADVLSVSSLGADFGTMKQLRQLLRNSRSFRLDRSALGVSSADVLVIHRLVLSQCDEAFHHACDICIDEMKGDASCLEFSISSGCGTMALVAARFISAEGAAAYLQAFQNWMNRDDAGSLGRRGELSSVQVHARGPELKTLRAVPEIAEGVQLFQVFPLSFEASQATLASATMPDFVDDVESVLRYLGVSRATVVGHSMGAAVALMHAISHPSSVERLCTSGGAPRVGQLAKANWLRLAGSRMAWVTNIMRTAVSVANMEDADLQQIDAPTLLINAVDDELTPIEGSRMLRATLPNSLLFAAESGGHSALILNLAAFERLARFMMADDAMVFAEDTLLAEWVTSSWNLAGDRAFMRYYSCGCALAEVERAQRKLRLIRNWSRECDAEEELYVREPGLGPGQFHARIEEVEQRRDARWARAQAEQEDMLAALRNRGLQGLLPPEGGSPREVLLAEMTRALRQMSAPAASAVEQAGVWWRDTGRASEGLTEGKYTVDAWLRRRGGSKKHGCVWYRWDTNCVPVEMREGLLRGIVAESADSEVFCCWWCGGPPGGHEDLGPASSNEPAGFFPGLGAGRKTWQKPVPGGNAVPEAHVETVGYDPMLPLAG